MYHLGVRIAQTPLTYTPSFLRSSLSHSFNISLHRSLLLIDYVNGIQCPYRTGECMFLLVGQHLCAHVQEVIGEHRLWICFNFKQCLVVLIRRFMWWEVSRHTIWCFFWVGAADRIRWKQHKTFLQNSYLAFS